ncbi:LPP20 lipoprotein [Alteromonadaceae bacterium Bs31]|nr:LPP20 lipoprotein [Alteromonadaceae bacterium Bs31]
MWVKIVPLSICLMLLSACGSQSHKDEQLSPSWLNGESERYSRSQYLYGVGEADTMTSAKSRARAEIARIFSVDIQAASSDSSIYEILDLGGDEGASESMAVSQTIETRTEQRVQGIEIPEVWKDESSQRYYALAILPRNKTAISLRKDIASLDEATEAVLTSAQASKALFQKAQLANTAIALQSKRSLLADQLSVVALTGNDVAEKWSLQKLAADRSALLSRISVTTRAEGFEHEKMKAVLANTLANDGFTVSQDGEYTIVVNLDATELEPKGAWYYNKATLTVSAFDANNNSLGGNSWDYKVSATDASLSGLRVIEQAKAILAKDLTKSFFSMME